MTQANLNTPNALQSALDAATPAERQALLSSLLASAAMPVNLTPAQKAAAGGAVHSVPGIVAMDAGKLEPEGGSCSFRYATSSLIAGRSFRTNAAGLYTTLLALVALQDRPSTHQAIADQAAKSGAKRNADVAWCGSRDLADIQLAQVASVGSRKGIKVTAAGMQHAVVVLAASAALEMPVWVCPFSMQVVDASNNEVLGDFTTLTTPNNEEAPAPYRLPEQEAVLQAEATAEAAVEEVDASNKAEKATKKAPRAKKGA